MQVVAPSGASKKQLIAFNLCDGTLSQGQIAKKLNLDAGNFSRTVGRWVEAGVVFRIGSEREERLRHIFPLPHSSAANREK